MPQAQYNSMAGMTLIALCGLSPHAAWSSAERRRCTVTKGIMDYLEEHYGTNYAPNTRETFRRQVLHQFVQGGIADYNPFEPDLPTNSPKAHYAVTEFALDVVRRYGTKGWASAVDRFRREQGALVERYARDRNRSLIPVRLPDGGELRLSPGRHNEVQRAIVEEFGPRFAPGAHLLYLGDTAKKDLLVDKDRLSGLGTTAVPKLRLLCRTEPSTISSRHLHTLHLFVRDKVLRRPIETAFEDGQPAGFLDFRIWG